MSTAIIVTDEERGQCIQRARKWLGWSQERLADEANLFYHTNGKFQKMTRNVIRCLETGKPASVAQMDAIARATGQKFQYFNGGEFTTEPIPGQLAGFKPSPRSRTSQVGVDDDSLMNQACMA